MDQLQLSTEFSNCTPNGTPFERFVLGDSVLEKLLKTNRSPTDQERAVIYESMAPTNEKLRVVEAQITDTAYHIQALQLKLSSVEFKLCRLREEKAAILETSKDHRSVLSAIRHLPEDVLREILIACVEDEKPPILSYSPIPLPYRLAQISSGFRRIALSTPIIWASMDVQFDPFYYENLNARDYSILAHMATEWFGRAGGLPITVFIDCPSRSTNTQYGESDPSNILFDALFSFSSRWGHIQFNYSDSQFSRRVLRIVTLKTADVPLLQSVSLRLDCSIPTAVLSNTALFNAPTLRHVSLKTDNLRQIPVNWADLTAISLRGKLYSSVNSYSKNELARIFRETKRLVSCDIAVGPPCLGEENVFEETSLPFLQTLHITEGTSRSQLATSTECPSLLDLLSAPILAELHIRGQFFKLSLLNFLQRTTNISELDLPYMKNDKSLEITSAFLRYCPSLTALSLYPCDDEIDSRPFIWDANIFLRSFVQVDGDTGVTCPYLQFFKIEGTIDYSLETFRLFLEEKQHLPVTQNISPCGVAPWRMVTIGFRGIKETETKNEVLSFIFQKKLEGMNVDIAL